MCGHVDDVRSDSDPDDPDAKPTEDCGMFCRLTHAVTHCLAACEQNNGVWTCGMCAYGVCECSVHDCGMCASVVCGPVACARVMCTV